MRNSRLRESDYLVLEHTEYLNLDLPDFISYMYFDERHASGHSLAEFHLEQLSVSIFSLLRLLAERQAANEIITFASTYSSPASNLARLGMNSLSLTGSP